MFCPSCGKGIPEDSIFCEFCGARRASVSPLVATAIANQVSGAVIPHAQLSREQLAGMLFKNITLGEKFVAFGSLAAILGFFLPWGTIPTFAGMDFKSFLGQERPTITTSIVTGLDIGRLWGAFYLLLAGAIAAAVLFFISGKSSTQKKLTISGFQVMIGSLVGPQMLLAVLLTPMAQQVAGFGWWATCLGYCAIAAGGIISIKELAARERA